MRECIMFLTLTASNAPEDLIYVYVTARLPGAMEPQYDVMSRATVDRYRAFSARPNGAGLDQSLRGNGEGCMRETAAQDSAQVQPGTG